VVKLTYISSYEDLGADSSTWVIHPLVEYVMIYHILRSNYAPSDTGDEATPGDSLATRMLEMVMRALIHTPVPWWWGNEESSYAYDAIKMCLIFGAQYDDLFVRLDACRDDMYSTVPVLAVKIFCSACNYPQYQWMPPQSMLVQDLLRFDGEVSFEELLECAFPTHYHELYALMEMHIWSRLLHLPHRARKDITPRFLLFL